MGYSTAARPVGVPPSRGRAENPKAELQPPGAPLPLLRPPVPARDPLEEAREELARGNYSRVCELAGGLPEDPAACALHVRALANEETERAEQVCAAAAARHPLAVELHYLHAVLLLALRRLDEAARALRRVLYLDRRLAPAHFLLAAIREQHGDRAGAARAYRNARELCAGRPEDEALPLAEDARAGSLAEAAAIRLAVLESGGKER
jgi:chemotaxis protein methyltransferase CheR